MRGIDTRNLQDFALNSMIFLALEKNIQNWIERDAPAFSLRDDREGACARKGRAARHGGTTWGLEL